MSRWRLRRSRGLCPLKTPGLLGDTSENDRERRVAGVGDELFAPVEPPAIPFADRSSAKRRGIASRGRLGQGEGRKATAIDEPREPAATLLGRAIADERAVHDAGVHRDADREGGPGSGELLEDQGERDGRCAEAAKWLRDGHPEHPKPSELANDVSRDLARLLGRRNALAKARRPAGHRRREIAFGLADEGPHVLRTFFTASVNAGTNSNTSATTP